MARDNEATWLPVLSGTSGPIYLAIVEVMAADIAAGRLAAGQQLPTHRKLARDLGINLTTVTRAYGEAARRGLIEAGIGRGTFVRGGTRSAAMRPVEAARPIDMAMNLPPQPEDAALRRRVAEGMAGLTQRADFGDLLTYGPTVGRDADRMAGARWLQPRFGAMLPAERVLVCAGAQAALLALVTTFLRRDDLVVTGSLTYSGFRAMAAHFGIRLQGLAMDGEGILPAALEEACRRQKPQALYCTPAIHNPTTATMSPERRAAIVDIARRHGLRIFEDDAYGALHREALPPLAGLAPELTYHVAGLAKCLAPGLRIAYLVVPEGETARLSAAIRATTLMPPPLMAALATQWIVDGTARRIAQAIGEETRARQRLATETLPAGSFASHPDGPHLWLRLPAPWTRSGFDAYLRPLGLGVVASDAFALGEPPEAVRIALGAAPDRARLVQALRLVAEGLAQGPVHGPAPLAMVV
jgi:DNA-binding transcriptional MocR family regulator